MPRVSVIIPSYNHATFIARAIESVLRQDFDDFELLVEDDGSADNTENVLKSFSDSRLSYVLNEINSGAGIVTERLIKRAKGEYIALLNSDDSWAQGKLSAQVSWLDAHPETAACFTRATFIDESDNPTSEGSFSYANVFDVENRSAGAWLRHFFYKGNCLCNPSVMIRATVFDDIGTYKNILRQLPDLEFWIRLLKKHSIHVLDKQYVNMRIMKDGSNASSELGSNAERILLEYSLILENYFEDMDIGHLKEGFGDLLRDKEISNIHQYQINTAFLYFQPAIAGLQPILGLIGCRKLYKLMNDAATREILRTQYAFSETEFQQLGVYGSVFLPRHLTYPSWYRTASRLYRRLFPRKP
ncbi:glycosyltransferase [Asticcacaulis sp. DXS10W]|uniref:Glycosyltransferase n=1 Tax=Asticcacaulis currens TaxID=2984210 RepID=A0ABT5I9G2_9CAUL|nr:glycosyltransferase [Asticcacaulis currens]MDC7692829.1 glycosyltransferase [Asticcacaulis currens]